MATSGADRRSGPTPVRRARAVAGLQQLPLTARAPVSQALGRAVRSFWATRQGATLVAHNPSEGLAARFSSAGVGLRLPSGSLGLSLRAISYGGRVSAVGSVRPSSAENQVSYARKEVDEWYVNGPLGIEQGFTLFAPDRRAARGPVTIELRLSGSLRARLEGAGAVTFMSAKGRDGASLRRAARHRCAGTAAASIDLTDARRPLDPGRRGDALPAERRPVHPGVQAHRGSGRVEPDSSAGASRCRPTAARPSSAPRGMTTSTGRPGCLPARA